MNCYVIGICGLFFLSRPLGSSRGAPGAEWSVGGRQAAAVRGEKKRQGARCKCSLLFSSSGFSNCRSGFGLIAIFNNLQQVPYTKLEAGVENEREKRGEKRLLKKKKKKNRFLVFGPSSVRANSFS